MNRTFELIELIAEGQRFAANRPTDVRLVSRDLDWAHGEGDDLVATSQELLLGITGRRPLPLPA